MLVVLSVLILFFGVTFLFWVFYAILSVTMLLFYTLFSLRECPHCAKAIKKVDTSLTLRDLVKSAEAKRWMHPEAM